MSDVFLLLFWNFFKSYSFCVELALLVCLSISLFPHAKHIDIDPGKLNKPRGVACARSGEIFVVSDTGNQRIFVSDIVYCECRVYIVHCTVCSGCKMYNKFPHNALRRVQVSS